MLLALSAGASAQDKAGVSTNSGPSTAVSPSAGLVNDWLRSESHFFDPWDFGGQVRARYEGKAYFAVANENAVDFEKKGDAWNGYFLLRERVHLGYTPCPWFQIYSEMQDAGAYGDDRNPSPDTDHYGLRQAWVGLGNLEAFPLILKVGRQELIYGDQRLIGTADWLNIGRTFDAAKLRFNSAKFWVDAFTSHPVIPDKTEFDESDDKDLFSGVYGSTRSLVPFQESQLYFLAHNVEERSTTEQNDKLYPLASPRDIYTVGARVKSLPGALGNWDYEAEGDYQFGRYKSSNTAPSLDQDAFAAHVAGGYTWMTTPATPRLGLEYNFASGDNNPNDGKHQTFDILFPSNHGLFGLMDFFSWQNVQNVRLSASARPVKDLSVNLGLSEYWLANTHDYFYAGNGTPRKTGGYGLDPTAGSHVGAELDLSASYAITRFASAQAGYGHFFVSEYPEASLATKGGTHDANYVYAQLYFNF